MVKRNTLGSKKINTKSKSDVILDGDMKNIYNANSQAGAVSEIYRKDYISSMYHFEVEKVNKAEVIKINQNWKSAWNDPIQVANMDKVNRLPASVKPVSPKLIREDFKLPKERISSIHNTINHIHHTASSMYDLDEEDRQYLKVCNAARKLKDEPLISKSELELALEAFEVECNTLLEEKLDTSKECLMICDVCHTTDVEEGNIIVRCDICKTCVHQACYGLQQLPEGFFVCKPCNFKRPLKCDLCPISGGMMKLSADFKKWAHICCTLWMPETGIGDHKKMEPVTGLGKVAKFRRKLVCSVCHSNDGACIQCSVEKCETPFHVACAFYHGLEMVHELDCTHKEGMIMNSYCKKHSMDKNAPIVKEKIIAIPKSKMKPMIVNNLKPFLHEYEKNFYKLITPSEISEQLGIDPGKILSLYYYWTLKRKSNSYKPLLRLRDIRLKEASNERYTIQKLKDLIKRGGYLIAITHIKKQLKNNTTVIKKKLYNLYAQFFDLLCDAFEKHLINYKKMSALVVQFARPQSAILFDEKLEIIKVKKEMSKIKKLFNETQSNSSDEDNVKTETQPVEKHDTGQKSEEKIDVISVAELPTNIEVQKEIVSPPNCIKSEPENRTKVEEDKSNQTDIAENKLESNEILEEMSTSSESKPFNTDEKTNLRLNEIDKKIETSSTIKSDDGIVEKTVKVEDKLSSAVLSKELEKTGEIAESKPTDNDHIIPTDALPKSFGNEITETASDSTPIKIKETFETDLELKPVENEQDPKLSELKPIVEIDLNIETSDSKLSVEIDIKIETLDPKPIVEIDKPIETSDLKSIANIDQDCKTFDKKPIEEIVQNAEKSDLQPSIGNDEGINLSDSKPNKENNQKIKLSGPKLTIELKPIVIFHQDIKLSNLKHNAEKHQTIKTTNQKLIDGNNQKIESPESNEIDQKIKIISDLKPIENNPTTKASYASKPIRNDQKTKLSSESKPYKKDPRTKTSSESKLNKKDQKTKTSHEPKSFESDQKIKISDSNKIATSNSKSIGSDKKVEPSSKLPISDTATKTEKAHALSSQKRTERSKKHNSRKKRKDNKKEKSTIESQKISCIYFYPLKHSHPQIYIDQNLYPWVNKDTNFLTQVVVNKTMTTHFFKADNNNKRPYDSERDKSSKKKAVDYRKESSSKDLKLKVKLEKCDLHIKVIKALKHYKTLTENNRDQKLLLSNGKLPSSQDKQTKSHSIKSSSAHTNPTHYKNNYSSQSSPSSNITNKKKAHSKPSGDQIKRKHEDSDENFIAIKKIKSSPIEDEATSSNTNVPTPQSNINKLAGYKIPKKTNSGSILSVSPNIASSSPLSRINFPVQNSYSTNTSQPQRSCLPPKPSHNLKFTPHSSPNSSKEDRQKNNFTIH